MEKIHNNIIWILCLVGSVLLTGCSGTHSSSKQTQTNETSGGKMIINSVSPVSGTAGTGIAILGSGFGSSEGTVKFGDELASIISWSDTSINVVVPDIPAGSTKLYVISGTYTSNIDFTVLPFISAISKTDVILNESLVITGTGFGATQNNSTINFAGTVLPVTSWSNNLITLSIGNISHVATGILNMTINNTVSNGITLTVHPSISTISPDTAERGDEISISGSLFGSDQGTSTVTFSGIPAQITSWSNNFIKAKVPDKAVKGDVIINIDGILSTGHGFTVTKTFYSINQPTGLAMDENENIYVANYKDGTIIKVLAGGITQTTIYKGLNHPMGVYYQSPTTLFVACQGDGTIRKLTLGSPVTGYTFASGFSQPAGMVFDDAGNMYVTNYGNNTISKIDLSGSVSTFAAGLNKPMGIVFTGPTGGKTFKVANSGDGTIAVVDLFGALINPAFVSGIGLPHYIISDTNYNLYVTSVLNEITMITSLGATITYAIGLSNPYGLIMDPSGYLYASNFDANTISRIDNGYQVYAQGLYKPWGITFTTDGTMFVANQGDLSSGGGSISMVTTDGRVYPFVKPLDHSSCNPSARMLPMGITTGFYNNLFVATTINGLGGGGSISEVTYDGNASVLGDCFNYFGINSMGGIGFSSGSSLLYVTDYMAGRVFTVTANGKFYNFASGFYSPQGIALDSSGKVYIANAGNGTISQTTASGTFTTTYASRFSQPSGIFIDTQGNLYVSNYAGDSVSMVTPAKQVLNYATGIPAPTGITSRNGVVYVASESKGIVYKLIHTSYTYISGFNAPVGLAKDKDGMVYIADRDNNAIYRIDDASDAFTTFATGITSPAWFVFDNSGNAFISDFSNSTVLKLFNNSINIFTTGLSGPTGIAYDSINSLLYVGNYLNGSLSIVNSSGSMSTFAVGLSGPMGVALLSPGNLYVANSSNGTIAKVAQGIGVSVYATGFGLPVGITLDSQHNLYVADQTAGLIYLIDPDGKAFQFAKINAPYGISFDGNGNLFVSDINDKQIKEIVLY